MKKVGVLRSVFSHLQIGAVLGIAVLTASCGWLAGVGECALAKPVSHTLRTTLDEPDDDAAIVDAAQSIELRLESVTVVDKVSNDLERCILGEANVIDDKKDGDGNPRVVEVGAGGHGFLSREVEAELEAAARDLGQDQQVVEVGPFDWKELARTAITEKLKADYTLAATVRPQDFDEARSLDRKFDHELTFTQTHAGNPITKSAPKALLYRGRAGDVLSIDLSLHRTSLIARFLDKQLDELKNSSFFADTFSGLLSVPPLGAAGAKVGASIGGWLDKTAYGEARDRANTQGVVATGRVTLITGRGTSLPADPNRTLYSGLRTVRINAIVDDGQTGRADASFTVLEVAVSVKDLRL